MMAGCAGGREAAQEEAEKCGGGRGDMLLCRAAHTGGAAL